MLIVAAKVWHWWLALPLTAGGVGLVIALGVGYVNQVVKPRYPKKQ